MLRSRYSNQSILHYLYSSFLIITLLASCQSNKDQENKKTGSGIDRHALVTRHNVHLTAVDTLGSLSVGNGEFAFTVDATGLQTFPEEYENGIALGTMSQWAWHSIPSAREYSLNDVAKKYSSCNGKQVPYAIQHRDDPAAEASDWLRANPHRLHLGIAGLVITKENGETIKLSDLKSIDQTLDLWAGRIESNYEIEGRKVHVELYCHPDQDMIAASITSPLIEDGRLKVQFRFPYGNDCHVCPGYDWDHPEKHQTTLHDQTLLSAVLERKLDTTLYYVKLAWNDGTLQDRKEHKFEIVPSKDESTLQFTMCFRKNNDREVLPDFEAIKDSSTYAWERFWNTGGAIDFSGCTDPRAAELERRVVLSQYLTRIQCAGSLPPQETGLTMNSWYGKFHLEMHWWHEAQFALWKRLNLLEKSMSWYRQIEPKAKATAEWQGYKGARWPKMTDPCGNESPSSVGAFIAWQQPHFIYYAELFYRQNPDRALALYRDLVFSTADFMASFAQYSAKDKKYHLCSPIIPAQEIFKAEQTNDPPFELAYWHYTLSVAQQWRVRAKLPPNKQWQEVIDNLAPLAVKDGLYLPETNTQDAYTNDDNRRDHPVVTGAYGLLPYSARMDTAIMSKTFDNIIHHWNWETTWGWDYPMLAMSAARLGKPQEAIDALLLDTQKNTYLVNGHNYQDKRLRLYLPGNGGLLAAVAMMAAGWDGNTKKNPGFPNDGKWNIVWEDLQPMP